ncbi:unnamed protein product [Malus baccata var. baccata]
MQVSSQSSATQPEAILQWLQKEKLGEAASAAETREVPLQERDLAVKEVEKLRNIVKRQRKDLKARMVEVSRGEAERKRMLYELSKKRFKHSKSESLPSVHCAAILPEVRLDHL